MIGVLFAFFVTDYHYNFSIFISDGKTCKITLNDKKLLQRLNITVLDQNLAKAMQDYFLLKWEDAFELN